MHEAANLSTIDSLVPSLPFPNTNLRKKERSLTRTNIFFLLKNQLSRETGHEAIQ